MHSLKEQIECIKNMLFATENRLVITFQTLRTMTQCEWTIKNCDRFTSPCSYCKLGPPANGINRHLDSRYSQAIDLAHTQYGQEGLVPGPSSTHIALVTEDP